MAAMRIAAAILLIIFTGCTTIGVVKAQQKEAESDDCEADLLATGQYVLLLREQRDKYEQEVARLRYQVNRLNEDVKSLRQQGR